MAKRKRNDCMNKREEGLRMENERKQRGRGREQDRRHQGSCTKRVHKLLAMFTASSAVKMAVKALSSESSSVAAGVGLPAASVSRPVSSESMMLHVKFCAPDNAS